MERHLFTTKSNCPNKCQYCFEAFNNYTFPTINYCGVEKFSNCIIYPTCNTEFLCIKELNAFFEDYISKGELFNVFSFSTKNGINESDLFWITEINNKLKAKKIGEIKISISLSNKHFIKEIERDTSTYNERLSLAKTLIQTGIKTAVIIKPVLPFIEIEEYKEIINDFSAINICHFVTGNLYFDKNSYFYKEYLKDKGFSFTTKNIHWIESHPTWFQIDSYNMIKELSEYINSLNRYHYNSDKELVEDMFK